MDRHLLDAGSLLRLLRVATLIGVLPAVLRFQFRFLEGVLAQIETHHGRG